MKDDNLPPNNETVEDGGGCYVAGSREEDAAHSFDELIEQFNIKDMADKHALNEPHEMQAKVSFFTGANSLLPELTRLRSELQNTKSYYEDKLDARQRIIDRQFSELQQKDELIKKLIEAQKLQS